MVLSKKKKKPVPKGKKKLQCILEQQSTTEVLCSSDPKTFADTGVRICPFSINDAYRQHTASHHLQFKTKFKKHIPEK